METRRRRDIMFFAEYVILLLMVLAWVRFGYVRERIGANLMLVYVLDGAAMLYVLARAYLVVTQQASRRWGSAWLVIDLLIITGFVALTGGIHSEAALAYFWPLATSSITRAPARTFLVGLACALLYVAASWPQQATAVYFQALSVRLLVLLLATVLSYSYAAAETARVEELTRLREKVALADYRTRLSHEMHDGIQRDLERMAEQLALLRDTLPTDAPGALTLTSALRSTLGETAAESRYLVRRLRSSLLDQQGFLDALQEYVNAFALRSSMSASLDIEGDPAPLLPDREQAAFRIIQEALANSERHACCAEVRVRLSFSAERLQCLVADEGVGFDAGEDTRAQAGGAGLGMARERARSAGGELTVRSAPGQGTDVIFTLPLRGE